MSKRKIFESNSKLFQIWYFSILIFIGIAIFVLTDNRTHLILFLGINLFPLFFIGFIFQTFYEIKDGKLMKFSTGGKNSTPSLIINLKDIKSTSLIYKKEKLIGIKLLDQTKFELTRIYLEETQDFLISLNKEIDKIK